MAPDDDKSLMCPAHLPLVVQITRMQTTLDTQVVNQGRMDGKLDEIREKLADAKIIALKDLADLTSEIDRDRTKIKPLYWGIGIIGTAGIYEAWHWIRQIVVGK